MFTDGSQVKLFFALYNLQCHVMRRLAFYMHLTSYCKCAALEYADPAVRFLLAGLVKFFLQRLLSDILKGAARPTDTFQNAR